MTIVALKDKKMLQSSSVTQSKCLWEKGVYLSFSFHCPVASVWMGGEGDGEGKNRTCDATSCLWEKYLEDKVSMKSMGSRPQPAFHAFPRW